MTPHLRVLASCGVLAGAAMLGGVSLAAATTRLSFPCSAPTAAATVTCRLKGIGFIPREQVSIVYTITTRTTAARDTVTIVRRMALSDRSGAFRRPPISFRVDPGALAYAVRVTAAGARGDRATITTVGTP